jgi:hypothetical protein
MGCVQKIQLRGVFEVPVPAPQSEVPGNGWSNFLTWLKSTTNAWEPPDFNVASRNPPLA